MKKIPLRVAVLWAVMSAGMAPAQTVERLQPNFTFRSVGVATAGVSGGLVQIDPSAPSAIRAPDSAFADRESVTQAPTQAALAPSDAPVALPSPSGYEWFWSTISPRIEDSGPGRLDEALRALLNAPDGSRVYQPRVTTLQTIAQAHGAQILGATIGTDVSPALALAVIAVESGGQVEVVSHAGAAGLMQLMPATAERFGVEDRNDPGQNIRAGVAYLDWLLNHFDGDPILALAGYNAGEGAVRSNDGVPPYPETRGYVPKVLSAWAVARALCQTPPVLISDGCVFTVNNL